ncbi:cyclophilin-like fold protein [Micromonospora sp. NPDC023814]|uniref:cyclophilin-like fold protein n=1 Tax=Micromonospora sp. NPDC023814 TaxID=3154596 RepID=UPI0033FA0A7F
MTGAPFRSSTPLGWEHGSGLSATKRKDIHRMRTRLTTATTAALILACSLAACGGDSDPNTPRATPEASSPAPSTPGASQERGHQRVAGTVVRFTAGSIAVDVAIEEDTPTTRDFLSLLPMTLAFEDYGGREKVTNPPRPFDYDGATGMTPQNGDLFSYMPWGNLGFFYNADGLGHSDDLVRIGTTDAIDQLMHFDGQDVKIEIAD